MDALPALMHPILLAFADSFTQPTFQRWLLLGVAAIVTPGRRTVRNLVRTVALLAESGTVEVAGWPSGWARAGIAGRIAAVAEARRIERFIWTLRFDESRPVLGRMIYCRKRMI